MNPDYVTGNIVHLSRCGEKRASCADMVCALPVVSEAHNARPQHGWQGPLARQASVDGYWRRVEYEWIYLKAYDSIVKGWRFLGRRFHFTGYERRHQIWSR